MDNLCIHQIVYFIVAVICAYIIVFSNGDWQTMCNEIHELLTVMSTGAGMLYCLWSVILRNLNPQQRTDKNGICCSFIASIPIVCERERERLHMFPLKLRGVIECGDNEVQVFIPQYYLIP